MIIDKCYINDIDEKIIIFLLNRTMHKVSNLDTDNDEIVNIKINNILSIKENFTYLSCEFCKCKFRKQCKLK